jgi:hypothetical protein
MEDLFSVAETALESATKQGADITVVEEMGV